MLYLNQIDHPTQGTNTISYLCITICNADHLIIILLRLKDAGLHYDIIRLYHILRYFTAVKTVIFK